MKKEKGIFIVLDGLDRCGKTTQLEKLGRVLEKMGYKILSVREPGGTPLGEQVRANIKGDTGIKFGARAELLLFMAARAELVETIIAPALARGKIVLSDRFWLSSMVYQGIARSLSVDAIRAIGYFATNKLMPDLTIVLDISVDEWEKRGGKTDRIEGRGPRYLGKVRDGFLSLAKQMPRTIAIDGSQSVKQVHCEIMRKVKKLL